MPEGDDAVVELDREVLRYYQRGGEADRLRGGFPSGPLEFARTQELISRYLPQSQQRILDVGGASGIHAEWLTEAGHQVHLVDPVPLHIEQARSHGGFTAEVGDAGHLSQPDGSVDVVLLLGPLYHLQHRDDRIQALAEARRVVDDGGLIMVAAISRFAALFDLLVRLDRLHEPDVFATVSEGVRSGVFHGADGGLFTNAYFHLPDELRDEIAEAGLDCLQVFSIEGPGFLVQDFADRWADHDRRQAMLEAARLVETEASLMGASSHLLAVAQRPT